MRFDLLLVLKNFTVDRGQLFRRLASGHVRRVKAVERGRLVSLLAGRKYYGPELAYACHHRVVPMYPVVALDGNPHNLADSNLMPIRLKRLRFRVTASAGGFRHPLANGAFMSEDACRADWLEGAARYYGLDKAYIRRVEDETQPVKPGVPEVALTPRKLYEPRLGRPTRPEAVEGRSWHFWNGAWLSLPLPVHCSDDWMVRAAVVSAHPSARFVYDEVAQRTVHVL